MAPLVIRATLNKPNFQALRTRAEERRAALETARTMKIQRIQQDIERIVKREREYSQKLLEEIIPVKIIFNDDATKRLQDLLPFRIEITAQSPATPPPSPAATEAADAATDATATDAAASALATIPSARGTAP